MKEDRAVHHVDVVEDGHIGCDLGDMPRVRITRPAGCVGADPRELAATRVPLEDYAADVRAETTILDAVQDNLGDRNLGIERLVSRFPIDCLRQTFHLPAGVCMRLQG